MVKKDSTANNSTDSRANKYTNTSANSYTQDRANICSKSSANSLSNNLSTCLNKKNRSASSESKKSTSGWQTKKNLNNNKEIYFFSYHPGSSFLHRIPAAAKLIFIPFFSTAIFFLPAQINLCLVVFQIFIALTAGISIKEQLKDLKPIFLYVIIMEIFQLFIFVNQNIPLFTNFAEKQELDFSNVLQKAKIDFSYFLQGQKNLLLLFSRLFALIQCSSLLYKTSSSLQIRGGIEKIENSIRKLPGLKKQNRFSDSLFMFINFIPMLSRIFSDLQKAWLARGGKKNLKMYATLFPVLFSLGMKKAWSLTRAIQIRSIQNFDE